VHGIVGRKMMNHKTQQKTLYAHIGQRIRERRKLLRLNQSQLAEMMGFSYQQMQKYENGMSELSAGKLLLFAKNLNVPPHYFYENISLEESIGKAVKSDIIQTTRTRPLRLLLADDNLSDAILVQKMLMQCAEPTIFSTVHDGEAVLEHCQRQGKSSTFSCPDVVMMELSLPKVGGIEILKALKKHPKTQSLPVIILTHSISVREMTEAYKYGAAGFIQKSVQTEDAIQAMESLLCYWGRTVVLPCVG
jgi:CheY-like chemotaxis protein